MQRHRGVVYPTLFKGRGMDVRSLTLALLDRLAGLRDKQFLQSRFESGEHHVHDLRYGWRYRTGRKEGETTPEEVLNSESRRLRFLSDKLLETLSYGEKIFVYKRSQYKRDQRKPSIEGDIVPLYRVLRNYGQNFLLWVDLGDAQHPTGTIELMRPGIMLGYLDQFFKDNLAADQLARVIEGWTSLCKEASRLRKEQIAKDLSNSSKRTAQVGFTRNDNALNGPFCADCLRQSENILAGRLNSQVERIRARICEQAAYIHDFTNCAAPFSIGAGIAYSNHKAENGVPDFVRIEGRSPGAMSWGRTDGYSIRFPDPLEAAASGRHVSVRVIARAAGTGKTRFAIAYSTNEVGNSGWHWRGATPDWSVYGMEYDVPVMKNGNGDFVGILPGPEDQFGVEVSFLAVQIS